MTAEWLAARARNVSGALLVLIALAPLAARGAAQCASIEDPTARLACYDAAVGAFALGANSRDAALLVTLPPGQYSAQVSGVAGGTGEALVEVYEVP